MTSCVGTSRPLHAAAMLLNAARPLAANGPQWLLGWTTLSLMQRPGLNELAPLKPSRSAAPEPVLKREAER